MALALGINAGFVSETPVANPGGIATNFDTTMRAVKHTSPADVAKITEIGWWCDYAFQSANFEVGLYSHDVGNDKPDARLFVDNTNASGGVSGVWQTVAVDWEITAETIYWIVVQLDNTTSDTKIDYAVSGGTDSYKGTVTTLPETWPGDSSEASQIIAIYAVVGSGVEYSELSGTCAGTGDGSGDLELESYSALAGTCAAVGTGSGDLGSVLVRAGEYNTYKRLVAAGNNQIWYEDI